MKRFIGWILLYPILVSVSAFGQSSSAQSKIAYNNMLILDWLGNSWNFYTHFDIEYDYWAITDLSFEDFNEKVVIKTVPFEDKFGELVECKDVNKIIIRTVASIDSESDEYRLSALFNLSGNYIPYYKSVRLDNMKRFYEHSGNNLRYVYILPKGDDSIMNVYYGDGSKYMSKDMKLDDKGRIIEYENGIYKYDESDNIIAVLGRSGSIISEKINDNHWVIWRVVIRNGVVTIVDAKYDITINERNDKGLWTKMTIEYEKDAYGNIEYIKMQKIRYFDPQEDIN